MSNVEYFTATIWPICLKNCIFCSEWWFWKRDYYYDLDKFKSIILKNKPKKVSLSWWEPLLNPKILDYIKFCKELNIDVSLVTAWEEWFWLEFIEKLIDSWLDELMISLEWNEQVHDLLTTKKGSYKNIINTLYLLKKIDRKQLKVIINTNINKINFKILPLFISKILENFSFISIYHIQILQPQWSALKNKNILFDKYTILLKPFMDYIDNIYLNDKIKFWRLPYCFVVEKHTKYLSKAMNNFYLDSSWSIYQKKVIKNRFVWDKCLKCSKLNICDLPYNEYIEMFWEYEINPIIN